MPWVQWYLGLYCKDVHCCFRSWAKERDVAWKLCSLFFPAITCSGKPALRVSQHELSCLQHTLQLEGCESTHRSPCSSSGLCFCIPGKQCYLFTLEQSRENHKAVLHVSVTLNAYKPEQSWREDFHRNGLLRKSVISFYRRFQPPPY